MNRLYERTFDQVRMSEDKVQALRAELASKCSNSETEVIPMNTRKTLRRPTTFLVAAILIASLTMSALAAGIYSVVYHVLSDEEIATMTENGTLTELTGQDAVYEMDNYTYTEEDGQIIVNFDSAEVSYNILADEEAAAMAESGNSVDLTGQAADMEFSAYTYTEEDGKIIANIDP